MKLLTHNTLVTDDNMYSFKIISVDCDDKWIRVKTDKDASCLFFMYMIQSFYILAEDICIGEHKGDQL